MKRIASYWMLAFIFFSLPISAAERQMLHGHLPAAVAKLHLQPISRLPATMHLNLAIGLPLRNREALTNLLQQTYDPASTNYHHYLTPQQFTEMFGPTEQDYQAVIAFAKSNGLTVIATHPNRMLVDVSGSIEEIERTFHMTMRVYRHPTENRVFYAPNVNPSLDLAVPVLHISGLNNYILPHPKNLRVFPINKAANARPNAGSGPNGLYRGNDFRAAYAPGVWLDGSGQSVGLVEFDGYYTGDILAYANQAGLKNVALANVLVNGVSGVPGVNNREVALDIEMVISMAPNLSEVIVYEGEIGDDILSRIAEDNLAKQLSCSWGFITTPNTDQILQEIAAQRQSFFNASGDNGAYTGVIHTPDDNPYITIVGGTSLTTSGPGGYWVSETTLPSSGGGISTSYSIPSWQQGVSMSANQGSTTMRNIPDVALTADNIFVIADNGQQEALAGTSAAAPLWAAFTALVNQQATNYDEAPVGFINPAVYAIAKGSSYPSCFHDIMTGNNTNSNSPSAFFAVPGYDLCTGWGTPTGTNLINALAPPPTLPSITVQPQSQTVGWDDNATFTVQATGTPPLWYRWGYRTDQWGGLNMSGQNTATLTVTNVEGCGSFSVVVQNRWGWVNSSNAALTVGNPSPGSIMDRWGVGFLDSFDSFTYGITNSVGIGTFSPPGIINFGVKTFGDTINFGKMVYYRPEPPYWFNVIAEIGYTNYTGAVAITAPSAITVSGPPTSGSYTFQKWQLYSCDCSTNPTITVSQHPYALLKAVYSFVSSNSNPPPTTTLTVNSSNPNSGVSITVSPSDNGGNGNGNTPFSRTYDNDTQVTLTAPLTANGNNFQGWQLVGGGDPPDPSISVSMYVDYTVTAVYVTPATHILTVLHPFGGSPDGSRPAAGLVLSSDGYLYGTTYSGGTNDLGTVFKISSAGALTTLYQFSGADGSWPWAALVQGCDGYFYGTTDGGGTNDLGTVFKISPAGVLTTLYRFGGGDGSWPDAALVQGSDGYFYGTTDGGGTNDLGTVFKISSAGVLTTLYRFGGDDGSWPDAALVQGSDGYFYGTTYSGGTNDLGTVFKISSAGALTTMYQFSGADGSWPWAALVQGCDGYFYGTTYSGGMNNCGTIFKISPTGAFTMLYQFNGTDGSNPAAGLVLGSDGYFYGTTDGGGENYLGTVFRLSPAGVLTTLHEFSGADGSRPDSVLVQGSDGGFYGTTAYGGRINNLGGVFKINLLLCAHGISTSSSPIGGGCASGSGVYDCGETVTVCASPNSGYTFANWTENGSVVSESSCFLFTAVSNRNLIANFVQESPFPHFDSPFWNTNGFNLTLQGPLEFNYQIEASTDLFTWLPLTNLIITNMPFYLIDSQATNYNQRFYRAIRQ